MKNINDILASIRALAKGITPKTGIDDLLYHHKCYYLMNKKKDTNMMLQDILNRNSVNIRFDTCRDVFDQLKANNIPYAVIKGVPLSKLIYNNPYIRRSGDIDLLINAKDCDNVKGIFHSSNFTQGRITDDGLIPYTRSELLYHTTMTHQLAPFIKKTASPLCPYVNIDINTNIIWGESHEKIDMGFVLKHTEETEFNGIGFVKLSREMEFISLCLHHYKDMNSLYLLNKGSLKLSLLCDIFFYIKNTELNLDVIHNIAKKFNVQEYIYYCVYHTDIIFNDNKLKDVCTHLYTEKSEKIINRFGLCENEWHEWDIDFCERLFNTNIHEYFLHVLNQNDWKKIDINNSIM